MREDKEILDRVKDYRSLIDAIDKKRKEKHYAIYDEAISELKTRIKELLWSLGQDRPGYDELKILDGIIDEENKKIKEKG